VGIVVYELDVRGGTQKQVLRLAEFLHKNKIPFTIYTYSFDATSCYPGFMEFADRICYLSNQERLGRNTRKGSPCFIKRLAQYLPFMNLVRRLAHTYRLYKNFGSEHTLINFHDHTVYWIALFYKLRIRGIKPKFVWQLNDFPPMYHVGPSAGHNKDIRHYIAYVLWLPVMVLDQVIVHQLINEISVNVGKNKGLVRSIYGRAAHLFYPGIDQPRRVKELEDFHSPIRLVTTSVLLPYRRIEDIIIAMRILKKKGIKTILNIIGAYNYSKKGASYYQRLRSLVSEAGLQEEVGFLGQIDAGRMEKIWMDSDVFLFVNHMQSWGLAVFEAMSVGLPVIVSSTVGATEILETDKNAIIVEPKNPEAIADGIITLESDREYRNALIKNALDLVATYKWDSAYSANMLNLFQQLSNVSGR